MNNIVSSWEVEVNPTGEIELEDEQLSAVFGAWYGGGEHYQPKCEGEYSQPTYGYSRPTYGYSQPTYGYSQPTYGGLYQPRCEEKEYYKVVYEKKSKCYY